MARMSIVIRKASQGFACPRCGQTVAEGEFCKIVNGRAYCEACGRVVMMNPELAGPYRCSSGHRPAETWPMHCDALMVADEDLAEAKAVTGCEYDSENRPIITGASHYKRVLKQTGFVDRSA